MEAWLTPERIAQALPVIKAAFWGLFGLALLLAIRRSWAGKQQKTISRAYRIFFVIVAMLFAAILVYQATWQLAGFARPDFIDFMKRYNRRPDNPVANIVRGSIYDARGNDLAVTDPAMPARRWYPLGAAAGHLIGYDHSQFGLAGIEAADRDALNGITREQGPEWENFRRNLLKRDDVRGRHVMLTVHAALQQEAHALMKGRKGAVVLLDPSNGAILALYSAPGFDPNDVNASWFERKDPDARLLNRALQGLYPAGSTFKLLVAAAALDQGINPVIDCPAEGYRAGTANKPIRDHEYYDYQRRGRTWPGHGALNMREALAKSSNVYFARLGVQLGGERLYAAVVRCGMTKPWTVFDGSSGAMGCTAGRFPALTDRDIAKTAQISIGQGDMVITPLHMAMLAGAIGRQGVMWKPRLDVRAPAQPLETVFKAEAARTLAGMMRQAVMSGTGRGADLPGLQVAGKTGTAQNPHGADHGWFVGFAPVTQPRVAFAVVVEGGGYGSQSAVPVVAGLLRKADEEGLFAAPAGKAGR